MILGKYVVTFGLPTYTKASDTEPTAQQISVSVPPDTQVVEAITAFFMGATTVAELEGVPVKDIPEVLGSIWDAFISSFAESDGMTA